ncbi:hypothetical protein GH733_019349, partial [Mirounga leonina]
MNLLRLSSNVEDQTFYRSGFGNMGPHTMLYLYHFDVRWVGVGKSDGNIWEPDSIYPRELEDSKLQMNKIGQDCLFCRLIVLVKKHGAGDVSSGRNPGQPEQQPKVGNQRGPRSGNGGQFLMEGGEGDGEGEGEEEEEEEEEELEEKGRRREGREGGRSKKQQKDQPGSSDDVSPLPLPATEGLGQEAKRQRGLIGGGEEEAVPRSLHGGCSSQLQNVQRQKRDNEFVLPAKIWTCEVRLAVTGGPLVKEKSLLRPDQSPIEMKTPTSSLKNALVTYGLDACATPPTGLPFIQPHPPPLIHSGHLLLGLRGLWKTIYTLHKLAAFNVQIKTQKWYLILQELQAQCIRCVFHEDDGGKEMIVPRAMGSGLELWLSAEESRLLLFILS